MTDENDLMIINKSGVTIRVNVDSLSILGRATQGVRLINLDKRNDEIASVCKVLSEPVEAEEGQELPSGEGESVDNDQQDSLQTPESEE